MWYKSQHQCYNNCFIWFLLCSIIDLDIRIRCHLSIEPDFTLLSWSFGTMYDDRKVIISHTYFKHMNLHYSGLHCLVYSTSLPAHFITCTGLKYLILNIVELNKCGHSMHFLFLHSSIFILVFRSQTHAFCH